MNKRIGNWMLAVVLLFVLLPVLTTHTQAANTVTVSYDGNGGVGTMTPQTVTKGTKVQLKANGFTRDGYTFQNWNTKKDGLGAVYAVGADVTPYADICFYAQWISNSVTVTFDANDGTTARESQAIPRNTATKLNTGVFSRSGYSLLTWNTAADGSGTDYADGQSVTLSSNITLYAIWSPCITFYANDDTSGKYVQMLKSGDTTATLTANKFSARGRDFLEWNTRSGGSGTSYRNKDTITVGAGATQHISLYAQWSFHHYTVVFDPNGGSGDMSDQEFTYGYSQRLYANNFEYEGRTFRGWATSADGSRVYNDRESVMNLSAIDGDTVTLYAVWSGSSSYDTVIQLRRGNTSYGREESSSGSRYRFSRPRTGAYNLVIESGNRTMTSLVVATGSDVTGTAKFPNAMVNSVLVVRSNTPDVVVGYLDDAVYDMRKSGSTVTLRMIIGKVSENSTGSQFSAIRAVSGNRSLTFYDLTLQKLINGSEDRNFTGETDANLKIYLPYVSITGLEPVVYRWHNGVVDTLTTDARNDEYVAIEEGMAVVHARKFSTYALGYAEVSNQPQSQSQTSVTVTPDGTIAVKSPYYVSCQYDDSCPISRFYVDSSPSAWYHDGVHWALEKNIMNGYSPHTFAPDDRITRAGLVTMLWRLSGNPAGTAQLKFKDVPANAWYTNAVRWAVGAGIVTGSNARTFSPDEAITREELSVMLYRHAKYKGVRTDDLWTLLAGYQDTSDVSSWSYDAICWLTRNGILTGTTTGDGEIRLNPRSASSRAQTATILMRYWNGVMR